MKKLEKVLQVITTITILWLLISFIEVNLKNGINDTESISHWNAFEMLITVLEDTTT